MSNITFQTIRTTCGFIQLSTIGNTTTIKAWAHDDKFLGNHYTTVAGAKGAITRNYQKWLRAQPPGTLKLEWTTTA